MAQASLLFFADLQIDIANEQVRRGQNALHLTPTTFALLQHLVEHAGQLVAKEELLQAIWPETAVTEGVLTTHVRQLRQVLGDNPKAPQFIETVHRRGYRFLPTITAPPVPSAKWQVPRLPPAPSTQHLAPTLVGRETELAQLHGWLDKALYGERQLIFVTGEPGIGKTTLVEAFLQSLESRVQRPASKGQIPQPYTVQTLDPRHQTLDGGVWIGRGQCIEHYGAGEAYLPILEALGRLCRGSEGPRLIELLMQHAPTWLVQMPALLGATELEALQRRTQGATRERMLRELAEAVEVLTDERGLVLWLEDLQWSDVSTLDWLAFVARRREPAQLLVLGTYRPVDVIVGNHPLKGIKHELHLHGQCEELPLRFLRQEDIEEYLAKRFAAPAPVSTGAACPEQSRRGWGEGLAPATLRKLAHLIHRRTDGNPLFMVNVVSELVTRGVLVQSDGRWELQGGIEESIGGVPASVPELIERQQERLSAQEQRVLEVASVAGAEFSAAAVAAGLETTVEEVEEQCTELARREQFLYVQGTAEWPDGTVAAQYGFWHALYQEVLYDRIPARRRQRLHQRIGEREEQAYGEQAREIAAELALHFERGREYRKAVHYLQQAGENSSRRSAHQEAITLLTKGLELLKTLPDTPERIQQELRLQVTLGPALIAVKGFAAPEVGQTYVRAQELCGHITETPQLFPTLFGVWLFRWGRGELQPTRELGEQLLRLAQNRQDPVLLLQAHHALWPTLVYLGQLTSGRTHWERGIALYNPRHHPPLASHYGGHDPGVCCRNFAQVALWLTGYPGQALTKSHEALTLAQELAHPYSLALSLEFAARLHHLRREEQVARKRAEAVIVLSREQGFALTSAWGTILQGWVLVKQGKEEEGIAQIRQSLSALRARGTEIMRPYHLALLAEAYEVVDQREEGVSVVAEALDIVQKTGERWYEAELYRLKGQLTLQQSKVQSSKSKVPSTQPLTPSTQAEAEAEACFLKAIEVARKQQAKMWELRATVSLARLWQQQGKKKQAHKMLAKIYGWFTEGFDTKDLQEAKALLGELA
jgi:DNA-binding winged helix-turn-helix (wHTH) protein/predicted ATPase